MMEESFIACSWSEKLGPRFIRDDFATLEKWVHNNVTNWASCDTLCNHTIGDFIQKYPEYLGKLKEWARSDNRWVKRAAAVSLIIPARRGKFLDDIFEIADILLLDADDMVQKGYGWMLKAASQAHQEEVFNYVMQHKSVMPRTALRYAIEKMPAYPGRSYGERLEVILDAVIGFEDKSYSIKATCERPFLFFSTIIHFAGTPHPIILSAIPAIDSARIFGEKSHSFLN